MKNKNRVVNGVLLLLLSVCLVRLQVPYGASLDGPNILGDLGELGELEPVQEKKEVGVPFAQELLSSDPVLRHVSENLPSKAKLPMTWVDQNPELPTGCEAVSLTMALGSLGYPVDKVTFARKYLVYSDDLANGYLGDPFSYEGAGAFPPGIVLSANLYLQSVGSSVSAYEASGIGFENVLGFLALGKPVLLWVTMYYDEPWYEYGGEYYDEEEDEWYVFSDEGAGDTFQYGDQTYTWYLNEHCVALKGYDLDQGVVYVCDPLNGEMEVDLESLKELYDQIGGYGVVFYERSE